MSHDMTEAVSLKTRRLPSNEHHLTQKEIILYDIDFQKKTRTSRAPRRRFERLFIGSSQSYSVRGGFQSVLKSCPVNQ